MNAASDHSRQSRWLLPWIAVVIGAHLCAAAVLSAQEIVIYGFENSVEGWAIPEWAKSSADYVAEECHISGAHVVEGQRALELRTVFPGERWTGAYIERDVEVTDWSLFSRLLVDVYLPDSAPNGLEGKIILTVGDQWRWTEMNRSIPLRPGAWTTIAVILTPGSMDWKFFPDETFRANIRKVGIRVESNDGPVYRGSVFFDNVRLAE